MAAERLGIDRPNVQSFVTDAIQVGYSDKEQLLALRNTNSIVFEPNQEEFDNVIEDYLRLEDDF